MLGGCAAAALRENSRSAGERHRTDAAKQEVFSQAAVINSLLDAWGKDAANIEGKTYYRKPAHILKPKNLESMTISLKDSTAQRDYFQQGQHDAKALFARLF